MCVALKRNRPESSRGIFGQAPPSGLGDGALNSSQQSRLMFARQLVLPDPQHAPALRPQRACHQPVARLVRGELLPPERRIVSRFRGVLRTRVPEAAIHEHRQPQLGKHEVGTDAESSSLSALGRDRRHPRPSDGRGAGGEGLG